MKGRKQCPARSAPTCIVAGQARRTRPDEGAVCGPPPGRRECADQRRPAGPGHRRGVPGQLLTARDLKHQPLRVTVDPASPARTIAVIPDAWFQLHVAGAGTYSIAVELDHGTEHRPRWQTKVAAWAPPAPTRRPLTPTTSPSPSSPPARRDALAGWTRQALTAYGQPELADIFLLSCADPATTPAEQWFFQPHWHQPNTGQPVSLLEPAPVRQPLPDSS